MKICGVRMLEEPASHLTAIGEPLGHGTVVAVARRSRHAPSKEPCDRIRLVVGSGVDGDAHAGATVKHRSRVRRDPTQPNLRQVHLIHAELHDELAALGFSVAPADMGENVTTRGIDLLALPTGARLHLGVDAIVQVTGLRNPCTQLDTVQPGLMDATLERRDDGTLMRKAGVMSIVLTAGEIARGDTIRVELPPPPHHPLLPV